jgi:hypothetical protein
MEPPSGRKSFIFSWVFDQIPYSTDQGISKGYQGIICGDQGICFETTGKQFSSEGPQAVVTD